MRRLRPTSIVLLAACAAKPVPSAPPSVRVPGEHVYYVSVTGTATGSGSAGAPWDLATALVDKRVQPGDRIYVRGGRYVLPDRTASGFSIGLVGTENHRIVVRAMPGERVIIDGGFTNEHTACAHLIIQGFEVTVGENAHGHPTSAQAGSAPTDLGRPLGGINLFSGEDLAIIDNVVHDNTGVGISFWGMATGELAGNLIYANGWLGPDRHHGHGIYVQNGAVGWKRIRGNLVFDNFDVNIHAYGSSRAKVERLEVADNLVLGGPHSTDGRLLVGGPPLHEIVVANNLVAGASLQVGYGTVGGEADVTGNVIVRGELDAARVVGKLHHNQTAKQAVRVVADAYDPDRALIAIVGEVGTAEVTLPFRSGDPVAIRRADDPFGPPVLYARYTGAPLAVPVYGELTALVATRE